MCFCSNKLFIFYVLIVFGIHFDTKNAGGNIGLAQQPMAVYRNNSVSVERPASPMACPDTYCSLIKKAILKSTKHAHQPIHVNFGLSLLPVLQTVTLRSYDTANTRFVAAHQELIVTVWKNKLKQLMLNLLNKRTISGISITGYTPRDFAIFSPMIKCLIEANCNLQRIGLNYIAISH